MGNYNYFSTFAQKYVSLSAKRVTSFLPILSEDKMPSGNDWEVVTQEALEERRKQQKEQSVDPRLASLQSFFEKDETEK